MRTTIEMPDDLFRRLKARAAMDGVKLKDPVTAFVEQGLSRSASQDAGARRERSPLPVIRQATTGVPIRALSSAELARIEEELEFLHLQP